MKTPHQSLAPLTICLLVSLIAGNIDAQTCYTQCPCVPTYRCTVNHPVITGQHCQPICTYRVPNYNYATVRSTYITSPSIVVNQPTYYQTCAPTIIWSNMQSPVHSVLNTHPFSHVPNAVIVEQTFTGGAKFDDVPPSYPYCEAVCENLHPVNTKEYEECICDCLGGNESAPGLSKTPIPEN